MTCIGRTKNFKRCRNITKFPFCKAHRFQWIKFAGLTIPSVFALYFGLYKEFIRPLFYKESITEFLIRVETSINENSNFIVPNKVFKPYQEEGKVENEMPDFSSGKDAEHDLLLITECYENSKHKEAKRIIEKRFDVKLKTVDDYLGYIVSSYFGCGKFDKAAYIVLERDRARKPWDHSLKLDFAKCIRNYYLVSSLPEAISLIDSMKKKYTSNFISCFWACIPYAILCNIEHGENNRERIRYEFDNKSRKEMEYLLKKYPSDPYCSYGYYILGDFKNAIDCNKNSRIIDLCNYAFAENIQKFIINKYFIYAVSSKYSEVFFNQPIADKKDLKYVTEAINSLVSYYAGDTLNVYHNYVPPLIGWFYSCTGNYEKALDWLEEVPYSDDVYFTFKINLLKKIDKEAAIYFLTEHKNVNDQNFDFSRNRSEYTFIAMDCLPVNDLATFLKNKGDKKNRLVIQYFLREVISGQIERSIHVFQALIEKNALLSGEFEKYIKSDTNAYMTFNTFKQAKLYFDASGDQKDFSYRKLTSTILFEKNVRYNRTLAFILIQQGLKYFTLQNQKEYLLYLKIRTLTVLEPLSVEEEVQEFLKEYPAGEYADDVLAELIYVQFNILKYPEKGIRNLQVLMSKYYGRNACDNGYKVMAEYFFENAYVEISPYNRKNRNLNYEINKKFLVLFPFSRYRNKATERMNSEKDEHGI